MEVLFREGADDEAAPVFGGRHAFGREFGLASRGLGLNGLRCGGRSTGTLEPETTFARFRGCGFRFVDERNAMHHFQQNGLARRLTE